ncbi:MAG: hypothetical protein AABX93_00175 [Nanoarchaeota archaeon]
MDLKKLIGKEIKGQFLQNREGVENDIRGINSMKEELSPEDFRKYSLDVQKSKSPVEFSMRLLYINPSSGLFMARCEDFFGESAISGIILPGLHEIIHFQKAYVGESYFSDDCERNFNRQFRQFFHSGNYGVGNEKEFVAKGKYSMHGHNHLKGGIWNMESDLK